MLSDNQKLRASATGLGSSCSESEMNLICSQPVSAHGLASNAEVIVWTLLLDVTDLFQCFEYRQVIPSLGAKSLEAVVCSPVGLPAQCFLYLLEIPLE